MDYQQNKDIKSPIPTKRFSQVSDLMGSKFFIFDSELNSMFNNVKELYDTFKLAKKRFERKDTLQISKSIVQYRELLDDCIKYPYVLYDFIYLDTRICVTQFKKVYHIYSTYDASDRIKLLRSFDKNLYGNFNSLEEAKKWFCEYVKEYCLNVVLKELL